MISGAVLCCMTGLYILFRVTSMALSDWLYFSHIPHVLLMCFLAVVYIYLACLPMIFLFKTWKSEKRRIRPFFIGLLELLVFGWFILAILPILSN